MKALFACALLVAGVGGSADAAVTFSFATTPSYGFFLRHHVDGQADDITTGDDSQTVTGSFTIDTVAAGANTATPPAAHYEPGNTPFVTAGFSGPAIAGVGPLVYSSGVATHYVDADGGDYAVISYSWEDLDAGTGRFTRTTYELTGYGVTTAVLGGLLLPDFTTATDLGFSLTSQVGTNDDYYEYFAAGAIGTAQVAVVPEPATWGLMVLGFGLTGAALRRRKVALAA